MYNPMKSSWLSTGLLLFSVLPAVHANCFFDSEGFEHCNLSNGARIGIAIAIIVVALILIACALAYRRKRMQGSAFYVTSSGQAINSQNVAYGRGGGGYPSGYDAQSGYYPNGPQYPPTQPPYGGYAPENAYVPENTYAPPKGPPPPAYYAPPQGPPPAMVKSDV